MKKPLATSPSQEVSSDEDAIRAYYRKLGRVALLTREGEVVLAQRIESAEAKIVRALVGSGCRGAGARCTSARSSRSGVLRARDVTRNPADEEDEEAARARLLDLFGPVAELDRALCEDGCRAVPKKRAAACSALEQMRLTRAVLVRVVGRIRNKGEGREARATRLDAGHGALRRDRGRPRQGGAHRGEPAPRRLDRKEAHGAGASAQRPDPGGKHRPDARRRQVRLQARFQVLDVRDVVDPPVDHARDRRPGQDDPHARAHGGDGQPPRLGAQPSRAGLRPRAVARGDRQRGGPARRQGPDGPDGAARAA